MLRRINVVPNIPWCFSPGVEKDHLSYYFRYPATIPKVIYTTNATESVHRQFIKLTKTKCACPNENSLLKLLYLGLMNTQEKLTMPLLSWEFYTVPVGDLFLRPPQYSDYDVMIF